MAARKTANNPKPRPARVCECGDHAFTALTRGFVVLVDPDDIAIIAERPWCARPDKGTAYALGTIDGRVVQLHRVLLPTPHLVDHRNGDGVDNRRRNLREATASQNTAYRLRQRPGASGVVGVRKHHNKFTASINQGRTRISLGSFSTLEEAIRARETAMREQYGEFAPQRAKIVGRTQIPSRPLRSRNELRKTGQ